MEEVSWTDEEEDQFDSESCCSDCGSLIEGAVSKCTYREASAEGMFKMNEDCDDFILLKHRFYLSVGALSQRCSVVAAYQKQYCEPMERARIDAFKIFMDAMAVKRDGSPNVVHAWFGASKDEVDQIMKDGFCVRGMPTDGAPFGFGLHLYPERSACESVLSAPVDEDGLRYLVVCRVILGNTELILPDSRQSGPSSGEFDSGVDNLESPSKYIIWYPDVKTNVLPIYAVTIKSDIHLQGVKREPLMKPSSPWMPFTSLIYVLTKFLPRSTMRQIRRFHTDFLERKITRRQFVFHVRRIAGDKLLVYAIKDFQQKRNNGSLKMATRYK